MGSCILSLTLTMAFFLSLAFLVSGSLAGPAVPALTGNASSTAGCDADYGWLPGVEGSGKCYMLVKDYNQCGGDFYYGMDWFDALACCYLQPTVETCRTPGGLEALTCTRRVFGHGCLV